MTSSKFSDPQVFGPGIWFVIHTMAKWANNEAKKLEFQDFMKKICLELRCDKCSRHCSEYVDKHPLAPFWNLKESNGEEIGLFKWSVQFHNAVNDRIGKPTMDFKTAYDMYYKIEPCTAENCGAKSTSVVIDNRYDRQSYDYVPKPKKKDSESRSESKIRFRPV